jgi:DNA-binding IclR family transcriptional regulator
MSGLKNDTLQLLDRTFLILDYISSSDKPCILTEIVENTGISKPSVYRILSTLLNHRVVVKDRHNQYRMGPKVIQWGRACRGDSNLLNIATPYVDKIWDITGETIHLVSYEGGYAYYLLKKESKYPLQMRSRRGDPILLHSTAAGKAILFSLPHDEFISYLQSTPLERRTKNTITDTEKLIDQRKKFEHLGFSEEYQENENDIRCVGAPILNDTGYPIGAVSITCPIYLCDDKRSADLGELLKREVAKISREFGYVD